jgi:hypothetical protein
LFYELSPITISAWREVFLIDNFGCEIIITGGLEIELLKILIAIMFFSITELRMFLAGAEIIWVAGLFSFR